MVQANVYNAGTFRVGFTHASQQHEDALPGQIFVDQNVPNPFNASTIISFSTPAAMLVKISIYDLLGRRVCQFEERQFPAGRNTLRWDAIDDRGNSVSTGVYILSVTGGGKTVNRKMLYLR